MRISRWTESFGPKITQCFQLKLLLQLIIIIIIIIISSPPPQLLLSSLSPSTIRCSILALRSSTRSSTIALIDSSCVTCSTEFPPGGSNFRVNRTNPFSCSPDYRRTTECVCVCARARTVFLASYHGGRAQLKPDGTW